MLRGNIATMADEGTSLRWPPWRPRETAKPPRCRTDGFAFVPKTAAVAPCPQTTFGSAAVEPRVTCWFIFVRTFRSAVGGRPVSRGIARLNQHDCAFRDAKRKRSAWNQLPRSDLCEHLGMGMSHGENLFASRSLESLQTLGARLRCLASLRLG